MYSMGDVTVAARSSSGQIQYLTCNQQGTATLAIDSATLDVTRRYYDPYGNPIGAAPASWPGSEGFVGGTADPGHRPDQPWRPRVQPRHRCLYLP
jgi:hypothetical protein